MDDAGELGGVTLDVGFVEVAGGVDFGVDVGLIDVGADETEAAPGRHWE